MSIPEVTLKEIERDFKAGMSLIKLGQKYGINRKIISTELKNRGLHIIYRYTKDMYDKALVLFRQGKSLAVISKATGIDRHILSKKLDELGVRKQIAPKNRKGKFEDNDYNRKIKEAYLQGESIKQLATRLKRSTNYIQNVLQHYKVDNSARTTRKYQFDQNVFETIDTEEKAYWLGFLYADGCVDKNMRGVEITLKYSDKQHLEKFADFINSTPRIPVTSKIISLNGKKLQAWRISVNSKKLAIDLTNHGCTPQKSLTLAFPKWLDQSLLPHFMRGYFDGDGCLMLMKPPKPSWTPQLAYGIVGTMQFCLDYEDILIKRRILIRRTRLQPTGQAYQTSHGGNKQARRLFDFFYKDATIYLHRKYKLFTAVLGGNTYDD